MSAAVLLLLFGGLSPIVSAVTHEAPIVVVSPTPTAVPSAAPSAAVAAAPDVTVTPATEGDMADITIERGTEALRTFTIKDAADQPINITGATVTIRWRNGAGHGTPVEREATIINAAGGVVEYTFPDDEPWEFADVYHVRLIVDPAPNGTTGRFPDGAPLTLQAYRKV